MHDEDRNRRCELCNTEFIADHPRQRFCKFDCQQEYARTKRMLRTCALELCQVSIRKGQDFCEREHKRLYYEAHPDENKCIICGEPVAIPQKNAHLKLNYRYCCPLHRHWHWCDKNDLPRNDDVPNQPMPEIQNHGLPVKLFRPTGDSPEIQRDQLVLLQLVTDFARELEKTAPVKTTLYGRLVNKVCHATQEPQITYQWPWAPDHPIIQRYFAKDFALYDDAVRAAYDGVGSHILHHYIEWYVKEDRSKPLRIPKQPTRPKPAPTRSSMDKVPSKLTPKQMPHWKALMVLPDHKAYREAYGSLKPNVHEEKYMHLKETGQLTQAELKFQGGRYDFR